MSKSYESQLNNWVNKEKLGVDYPTVETESTADEAYE